MADALPNDRAPLSGGLEAEEQHEDNDNRARRSTTDKGDITEFFSKSVLIGDFDM